MISILIITNKADITSDFIVKRLKERRAYYYRLNTEEIGKSIDVVFDFLDNQFLIVDKTRGLTFDLTKIKSVYFRRPEINKTFHDLTDGEQNFIKSELLFTLEGLYKILDRAVWINKVSSIRNAENKIFQLLIAQEIGLRIPESIITNNNDNAQNFYQNVDNNCVIKPIKSGLVEGQNEESIIFTNKVTIDQNNKARINRCPIYLQRFVEKKGDVRVTVVGNQIFPAFIHSQKVKESEVDWRKANRSLEHSHLSLPEEIEKKCFLITQKLGLCFAAIDFVIDQNGDYIFLEINPNGQWAWVEKKLGLNISGAITTLLENYEN